MLKSTFFRVSLIISLLYSHFSFAKVVEHFACLTNKSYLEINMVDQIDWYKMGHDGHSWIHLEYGGETVIGVEYFEPSKDISHNMDMQNWLEQRKLAYADVQYYRAPIGVFVKYSLRTNPSIYYWAIPVPGTREIFVVPQSDGVCGENLTRNRLQQLYYMFIK